MTLRAGVAGYPIAHSLSPVVQGTWIEALGLDAVYERFGPRDETEFEALVQRVRTGEIRGLNVTAPYKAQALDLADVASDVARRCGSANLLVMRDGLLWADSTDGMGLMAALSDQAPGLDVSGQMVVILGAGGAARAAAAALADAGATVGVLNRTPERAQALASDLGGSIRAVTPSVLSEAALVVNAISAPPAIDLAILRDDAVLMDMTYRPLETAFLAAGRARGLVGVDGLAMLIGQAKPSFTALFGVGPPDLPPHDDARARALKAIGEAG